MKKALISLTLASCALLANISTSQAQTMSSDASLYKALGEKAGIASLTDDFVARLKADSRISEMFKNTKPQYLSSQLADQFCVVSGGPCKYSGADMKSSHSNLDIGKADFNALVEDLQKAMDAKGIPFSAQNELLAKLAPMHRDIINK